MDTKAHTLQHLFHLYLWVQNWPRVGPELAQRFLALVFQLQSFSPEVSDAQLPSPAGCCS